jgi:hypothetical protein
MVQYYHDMWAKRSEMPAPLSDLVGECGESKTTKKDKVKKRCVITTIFSTPGMPVSRRQWKLRYTRKGWEPSDP